MLAHTLHVLMLNHLLTGGIVHCERGVVVCGRGSNKKWRNRDEPLLRRHGGMPLGLVGGFEGSDSQVLCYGCPRYNDQFFCCLSVVFAGLGKTLLNAYFAIPKNKNGMRLFFIYINFNGSH